MVKNKNREPVPASASETIRRQLVELLTQREMGAQDLSRELGVAEKVVLTHLPHVARSAEARGQKFVIIPPVCLACDFQFRERDRYTRPGRCPKCKQSRISPPRFRIL